MARILVTGFEPFGNNKTNVSQAILERIESEILIEDPWYNLRTSPSGKRNINVIIEKQSLTVDEVGSKVVAKRVENNESWDLIIHMGLCETCENIRFELTAQNKLDMRIPDNSGRQLSDVLIGESNLYCNNSFSKSLNHSPIEHLTLSNDAGTYLCNETYYRTLESLSNRAINDTLNACFIHFPDESKVSVNESVLILKQIIARILFKPVIDVVGALIIDGDKIMLAKRNTTSEMAGVWEFPGGKIENSESDFEAIIREMDEEFGWKVYPNRFVSSVYHEYSTFAINLKVIEVSIEITESMEPNSRWTSHDEIGWFTNIEDLNIAQADYEIAISILNEINTK